MYKSRLINVYTLDKLLKLAFLQCIFVLIKRFVNKV